MESGDEEWKVPRSFPAIGKDGLIRRRKGFGAALLPTTARAATVSIVETWVARADGGRVPVPRDGDGRSTGVCRRRKDPKGDAAGSGERDGTDGLRHGGGA